MVPEDASEPSVEQPGAPPDPNAPQRPRRSGRGHRGRGRRRKQKRPQSESAGVPETQTPSLETAVEHHEPLEAESPQEGAAPFREEPETVESLSETSSASTAPPPSSYPTQSGSKMSVQMAIDDVNRIIDSLRDSLDDMEAVLEMLEQFERQSNADEREIESLRRALRHLQRPRDGGHPHRGR